MPGKRFIARAKALAAYDLAPEVLVPELMTFLCRTRNMSKGPSVLVVESSAAPPENFIVWRCSEVLVGPIRTMLAAGVWPGPSSLPPLQTLLTQRQNQHTFAATFWGEGALEDGPWVGLWRERDIRHGYYFTAFARDGRAVAGLMHRNGASPPFEAEDLAAGAALSPIVTELMERTPTPALTRPALVEEIQIAFEDSGQIATMALRGPEFFRLAGGGGPNAMRDLFARVEALSRAALKLDEGPKPDIVASDGAQVEFEKRYFMLMHSPMRTLPVQVLAENGFGRFEIALTAGAGVDGRLCLLGTLRRHVPRALLIVRALALSSAPAREIELARWLEADVSLPQAASAMQLTPATVKTLFARLAERFGAAEREGLVAAMAEAGRAAWIDT